MNLLLQAVPEGPSDAQVVIVTDIPSKDKFGKHRPLTGAAYYMVKELLAEVGIPYEATFVTSVLRSAVEEAEADAMEATTLRGRTAEHQLVDGHWVLPTLRMGRDLVRAEVKAINPTIVIALGDWASWAMTGKKSVHKWRSSLLPGPGDIKCIPTFHPRDIFRNYANRPLLINDLRRVKAELDRGPGIIPVEYRFIIRPNYAKAVETLQGLLARLDASPLPIPLAADIETRAGHTACIGIAWSRLDAICIPWMCVEQPEGYWPLEQEAALAHLLNRILMHPRASVTWQNGAYDHQYEARWHFTLPNLGWDTMLAHHAIYSISPKALDFLSSIYCKEHVYWKDDGKTWDPSLPEDQLWRYNCEDCVRTFEIREEEERAIRELSADWPRLPEVVAFQHAIQPVFVKMMLRGMRADEATRVRMGMALSQRCLALRKEVEELAGQPLNHGSSKQMVEFFYTVLGQTPNYAKRKPGTPPSLTADDEALEKVAAREPLLRPLVERIQALRSGEKFQSTYIEMRRDDDGRYRCSYNVAGTKTYRLSSSTNAFGSGGNLQNIPAGDEDEAALIYLPNIRKLFLFDEGMIGFDLDGDSADLRIVTGESGCRQMQAYFASGAKPYVEIAKEFYRDPSITKHHPSYKRMKALCHGSNYGGEPAGLSERIGLPVHDIERMQRWYFGMCPEIRKWQEDILAQGESRGYIENPFGYRLYRWDRWSRKLGNEFLAWIPQSTVGLLINRIALAIDRTLPDVELLLQVHDSLTGQMPTQVARERQRQVLDIASGIVIPCASGPIQVPAGMKTSAVSWGDCE